MQEQQLDAPNVYDNNDGLEHHLMSIDERSGAVWVMCPYSNISSFLTLCFLARSASVPNATRLLLSPTSLARLWPDVFRKHLLIRSLCMGVILDVLSSQTVWGHIHLPIWFNSAGPPWYFEYLIRLYHRHQTAARRTAPPHSRPCSTTIQLPCICGGDPPLREQATMALEIQRTSRETRVL